MRTQVEILVESIANLHIQLSASLSRESQLVEENQKLAYELSRIHSNSSNSSTDSAVLQTENPAQRADN